MRETTNFQLSKEIKREIKRQYDLDFIENCRPLTGGFRNLVYAVSANNQEFVLRIRNSCITLEDIKYEMAYIEYIASVLPIVQLPTLTKSNCFYFTFQNRFIFLLPWISGEVGNRTKYDIIESSAETLALFHQAALNYRKISSRPNFPPLLNLYWHQYPATALFENRRNITLTPYLLSNTEFDSWDSEAATIECLNQIVERHKFLEEEFIKIKKDIGNLDESHFVSAIIHGDYAPANVITNLSKITSVIDWDDCQLEALIFEIGRSIWEFCKNEDCESISSERASRFIKSYQDCGPVKDIPLEMIELAIRVYLIREISIFLLKAITGEKWYPTYTLENLCALENLRKNGSFMR